MLSCFLCGRSDSAKEPSPPHKCSPSSSKTKYCNAVKGESPLAKANLDVSSFDADAKKVGLSDSASYDSTSDCAYPSDASECSSIQKEIVSSTIVVKGKHTEEHSTCTKEVVKLDDEDVELDEDLRKDVQKDLKSSMQDAFSKHAAVDGANELVLCSSRIGDTNANCYNVVSNCESGCTETLADAFEEITSTPDLAEAEDASSEFQSFEAHGKTETRGIVPNWKTGGSHSEKKGLKSGKHKEPTHLFSYGISDQQRDFLFLCAGLVIQAVGFQLKSIVEVVTTIILLGYRAYFFASSLIDSLSQIKDWLHETHIKLLSHLEIKKHAKSLALHMEKLETMKPLLIAGAKRMGRGCVTAASLIALLTALLFISLVFSYFAVLKGSSTQKPIHITKELYFDYTKPHPVASLDLLSFNIYPKSNASKGIKANHMPSFRYRFTIFLTVPESNYNRNLGIFQVTSELSSETGAILSKASQPCMLHFKSNALHYVKSICLAIPLLAGATSETQILSLPSLEWQQNVLLPMRASVLTVSMVPRAGRSSIDGLPELYKAEIQVDSYCMSSSYSSGSSIRTLVMWMGLSFLLFGFLASFCMFKLHQRRSIS